MDNTENSRHPYPRMDIDFHRSETHSRGSHHYYSVIVTKIHYLVQYKCCFCGAENRDEDQFFELKNHTHAYDSITRNQKDAQVVSDIKNHAGSDAAFQKEMHIEARKYDLLGLKCRCAQCGRKQPWSDFRPASGLLGWIIGWIKRTRVNPDKITTTVMLLFLGLLLLFMGCPPAGLTSVVLMLLSSFAAMAHNILSQKKSLALKEEFRPEIRIVYKSESETTQAQ